MNSIPQVTGANKGIGFAIVRKLCKEFSGTVILTGRYCSTKLFPLVILRLHMKLDWCGASLNPTQPFLYRHATLLPFPWGGTLRDGTKIAAPEQRADILPIHHWFPYEMPPEKGTQKFHSDDVSLPRSGWFFCLVEAISHMAWPIRSATLNLP